MSLNDAHSPTELKFFLFSDPVSAKSRENKRLVRSHVARTSHAKSRHTRNSQRDMTLERPQESEPGGGSSGDDSVAVDEEPIPSSAGQGFNSLAPPASIASSWIASQNNPVEFPTHPLAFIDSEKRSQHQASVQQFPPWEQFLFDHFLTVIIPGRHEPYNPPNYPIDRSYYFRGMMEHWVPFCLTDLALLQAAFLSSCRSLVRIHRNCGNQAEADMYEQRALQYRGECLRSMRDCMPGNGSAVTDNTIGRALFLSCNEYTAGNFDEARSHMAACEDLVEMKGGHHTLGMDGFMSQLIFWFKHELSISQGGGTVDRIGSEATTP